MLIRNLHFPDTLPWLSVAAPQLQVLVQDQGLDGRMQLPIPVPRLVLVQVQCMLALCQARAFRPRRRQVPVISNRNRQHILANRLFFLRPTTARSRHVPAEMQRLVSQP